jgi:hypothetical protein
MSTHPIHRSDFDIGGQSDIFPLDMAIELSLGYQEIEESGQRMEGLRISAECQPKDEVPA